MSEYYGDMLRHFPPKGHEKKKRIRKEYLVEGVEGFCCRRALEIKQSFSEFKPYLDYIQILTYEEMIYDPKEYAKKAAQNIEHRT